MTLNPVVTFPVYTPTAARHWSPYRATWWAAPAIWLVWLIRGVRARVWGPPKGRAVTLADMRAFHPGRRPERCLCRGTGVLTSVKHGAAGSVEGVQLCEKMRAAFREQAGFRVSGDRWIKGFAPEELVRPETVRSRS